MWQRIAAATVCLMFLRAGAAMSADEPSADEAAEENATTSPIQMESRPLYVGEIRKIAGGKITVRRASEENAGGIDGDLEVGRYVAMVAETPENRDPNDMRLLQANVTDFADGVATLEQSRGVAGKLKSGFQLAFFAVRGADEEQLAAAPELTAVEIDESQPAGSVEAARAAARVSAATNNVKQIILGLHSFHDTLKGMPPAVIHGPDGEPWHSWRVLILPFIEEAAVYDEYKFDEPWNGPNNSKLLDKMPDVYRDPAYGDDEGHFTHFAAITGEGMAFTAEGTRFDGKDIRSGRRGGRTLSQFTNEDGSSMTLLIGSVSPEREIPWLKPEDVVVDDAFPGFDDQAGFAAPHAIGDERFGIFGFADGSVVSLPSDLEIDVFRKALTFDAGDDYDRDELRSLGSRPARQADQAISVMYEERDGEPIAVLRLGASE